MERHYVSMGWRDALFAHWPVDAEVVADSLPAGLTPRTHDDSAWLGIIAFVMEDIGPRGVPLGLTFPEVNLRTYVRDEERSAIYFFNLDADDPLGVAVARSLFRLPYYRAETEVERSGDRVRFRSRRTHGGASPARFEASYGPVEGAVAATPEPGSLEAFLVEHYRFYTTDDRGRVYHGDIDHGPWSLRPAWAEFEENTLFEASGFERPTGEPTLHVADRVEVTAGRVRRT